jgi:alpha-tubulin suppressor-like RCC1 family protein
VLALTEVAQINAGYAKTCTVLRTDGGVICWGDNTSGQLGGSTTINAGIKPNPTTVLGGAIFWK